jgi:hypothetical protein
MLGVSLSIPDQAVDAPDAGGGGGGAGSSGAATYFYLGF